MTTKYLTTDHSNGSKIPVKSISTSLLGASLLPRPIAQSVSTSTSHQRKTTTPKRSTRSTTTPKLTHRRRTSSTSSSKSGGWLSSLLSPSKKIKSLVRLSVENTAASKKKDWQIVDHCVRYTGSKSTKKYEFDHVFRETARNKDVFETGVKSTIENVMQGYNGTIFTYGQPGTGKTHTMFGNRGDPGLTALAFETMFESIKNDNEHEYILCISCFEITAAEIIKDLMVEEVTALKISDDNKRRGPYVMSLREQIITSPMEALQHIRKAEANRYLLSSNYETHHSRAHTFVQVTVEKREKQLPLPTRSNNTSGNISVISSTSSTTTSSSSRRTRVPSKPIRRRENIYISYLYLVDLASNDKSIYQSLKSPINKSCLALEAIVHNLSETGKSAGHPLPPYHDSKLTRLLQPIFTGQHNVVSICTLDMESATQDEIPTLDTLNFASRIKRIPISPKTCEVSEEKSLLVKYANDVIFLTAKLEKLEKEQGQINKDLTNIKFVLEQRLYNKSRLILTPQSLLNNPSQLNDIYHDDNDEDPWKMITQLRQPIDDNHLKSVTELPDEKIAQLEAELNMTRAELQVTQLLVNEKNDLSLFQ